MKEIQKRVINKFEQEHQCAVSKNNFTFLFWTAYKEAFDRKTIKAAFCVTGVYPFDWTVITDSQIKPSMPMSVQGKFPLLQPSPVHIVLAAMDMNPHLPVNTDILSVQSGPIAGPSRLCSDSFSPSLKWKQDPNINPVLYSDSPSPSPKWKWDPIINPVLYTQSKHAKKLLHVHGSSSSGSFSSLGVLFQLEDITSSLEEAQTMFYLKGMSWYLCMQFDPACHVLWQLQEKVCQPEACGALAPLISCACGVQTPWRQDKSRRFLSHAAINWLEIASNIDVGTVTYHFIRVFVQKLKAIEILSDICCQILGAAESWVVWVPWFEDSAVPFLSNTTSPITQCVFCLKRKKLEHRVFSNDGHTTIMTVSSSTLSSGKSVYMHFHTILKAPSIWPFVANGSIWLLAQLISSGTNFLQPSWMYPLICCRGRLETVGLSFQADFCFGSLDPVFIIATRSFLIVTPICKCKHSVIQNIRVSLWDGAWSLTWSVIYDRPFASRACGIGVYLLTGPELPASWGAVLGAVLFLFLTWVMTSSVSSSLNSPGGYGPSLLLLLSSTSVFTWLKVWLDLGQQTFTTWNY